MKNQRHRANGLNLLVTAIILWNNVYLQRAVDYLRKQGQHPAPTDLTHLSPYSPQVRGRSERNFGAWQGRLPLELQLH